MWRVTWEITYRRDDKGTCCGWGRVPFGSSVLDRVGTATADAAGAATVTGRAASGWKLQPLRCLNASRSDPGGGWRRGLEKVGAWGDEENWKT
jgi:hypothetical protein